MGTILLAQLRQTIRAPWAILGMLAMSVVLALVVGVQAVTSIGVGVLPEPGLSETATEEWLERLRTSTIFEFELMDDEEAALGRVAASGSGVLLRLGESSWQVLTAPGDESAQALAPFVDRIYREELTLRAAADSTARFDSLGELRTAVEGRLATPALSLRSSEVEAAVDFVYDNRTHGVFGMGLFFVTFTILFGVSMILEERRLGVWDRVILSPVSKASMFGGHYLFTFATGMLQLLVVYAIFRLGFGVSVGPNWGVALLVAAVYVAAITALGLLLAGVVRNVQQMNVVVPIVAVSMAMIGGAFWPIEIVSSRVLLALSQAFPMRHAMDALKGLSYHAWGFPEVAGGVAYMAAFGLVCAALGIWLVDRRS